MLEVRDSKFDSKLIFNVLLNEPEVIEIRKRRLSLEQKLALHWCRSLTLH